MSKPLSQADGAPAAFPANAASPVARLIAERRWDASLPEPEHWPAHLRFVVDLMLDSAVAMFAAWGPGLHLLYNDAYAAILGDKHPAALGAPLQKVWSEIWPQLDALVDKALRGETTYLEDWPLMVERRGYLEQAFFTFSYSPLRAGEGAIDGFFCTVIETTARVDAERRLVADRERFARLFEQAPSFMAMLEGPRHTVVLTNPAYQQLIGHRDLIGRTVAEALPDAVEQGYLDLLDRAYHGGEAIALTGSRYGVQVTPGGPVVERHVDFVYQPIFDTSGAATGIFVVGNDVSERVRGEEHQQLLINELNHRVKNSLATVQAIASQTFRRAEDSELARQVFAERLMALARAHDVLTASSWSGATFRDTAQTAVSPYANTRGTRFHLNGPDVLLAPRLSLSFAMALHELCTNAAKYGALSVDSGSVSIDWTVAASPAGPLLKVRWSEHGGPPVAAPVHQGFGSRLIQRGLAAELGGATQIDFDPYGVVCTIEAPLADPQADA